ncbi:hypothetical protein GEMRC1_000835 [Eukaryota sp. GEM-RC1]
MKLHKSTTTTVRSIDVKLLTELNPKVNAPDSAWNSWAEMFSKNSAIKANSVPKDIAHPFRNGDLPIDDLTDGFEMGFLVEELARRIDDIDRKRRRGIEDLIEDFPDFVRTAKKDQFRMSRVS